MIRQLPEPCWIAEGEQDRKHWDDPDTAADYLAGRLPVPAVVRMTAPCFTVTCDGHDGAPCGEKLFSEDECWIVHCADERDAAAALDPWEWAIAPDGRVNCYECRVEAAGGRVAVTEDGHVQCPGAP